ncbi:SGNH/GDSL hydrolase family protein [Mycoplasma enhydrae]|uniref:SGNH/GDSL hydrolase family protein n=1 Tax=Mycoplasma enhydrae TaxID=2499220 RepID=UPI00197BF67B|nr:SGNH/GDSL hydrolase family protein [Mycoplasma enhydrae]MBN4089450.1 SGNH/GDSL hydrolase family protein [Mycoplasma enhydrae]MCV3733506.1 SGNH/GDSL hydrolase family protein [Mycoplasma enhydrae]
MKNIIYKYLAIGDSISQGFNSKVGCGTAGYKNSKEFAMGNSYADYFMEFYLDYVIHRYNDNWQEHWNNIEMENISASTLRISDLNSLMNRTLNPSVLNVAEINDELQKRANLEPTQNFWTSDVNQTEQERFNYLSKKLIGRIKGADFLSISIGGNEFQSSYPFIKFRDLVLEKNLYRQKEIKEEILGSLQKTTAKIQSELDAFIKSIKQINDKLKITLVTYTPPFLHYYLRYEKFLRSKNPEIYNDFFKSNLSIFESIFKNVALDNKCIYVKSFNYKKWFKNSHILAENVIDVHPTELGYQEMAKKLFIAFLENRCLYNEIDKKYLNKISKFRIRYSKKISDRNKNYVDKKLFHFGPKQNKIVNILAVWCNQKNDLQNPYFTLLKRSVHEGIAKETIIKREQYTSLFSILSDQMMFILGYFDKKSKRYDFFKNKFITNDNILKFLVSALESESILKFLSLAESESLKNPKIAITKYIENVLNNNRQAIYDIFFEIINDKEYFYNLLQEFFDSTISDWKNGYFWLTISKPLRHLLNICFKDTRLINSFKALFERFLTSIKENNNTSNFFKTFLEKEFETLSNIIEISLYNIYLFYKDDKQAAVNIIIELLNIKASNLKYKNWKSLEKTVARIMKNITKKKFTKFLAKILIKTIINLKTKINLRSSFKKTVFIRTAKSFVRQILKHPFNKNAYILIIILSQLLKIKIKSALKIFHK